MLNVRRRKGRSLSWSFCLSRGCVATKIRFDSIDKQLLFRFMDFANRFRRQRVHFIIVPSQPYELLVFSYCSSYLVCDCSDLVDWTTSSSLGSYNGSSRIQVAPASTTLQTTSSRSVEKSASSRPTLSLSCFSKPKFV